mgnify:CR=1 FL=1
MMRSNGPRCLELLLVRDALIDAARAVLYGGCREASLTKT